MELLIIGTLVLILLICVIVEMKHAPIVEEKYWRYNQYKKRIEILSRNEQVNVECDSLKKARDVMKNSGLEEII